MRNTAESRKNVIEYYENARESFVAKMKSEEDERSNLKFKIAAFVIHELSYSTPAWFKNYFLTHIAKNDSNHKVADKEIINVENTFYDVVADYLIKMESENDYVKKILAQTTGDEDKKNFWQPIVFDAFLIVGIYFVPTLDWSNKRKDGITGKKKERDVNPRYLNYDHVDYKKNLTIRLNRAAAANGMRER